MTRQRGGVLLRLLKWIFLAVLALVGVTAGLVLALRWVDPVTSAFMLSARAEAAATKDATYRTDYRWVPLERISSHVALAVIASEDQLFPFHDGFDLNSIREAVRASEHGKRLRGAARSPSRSPRICSCGQATASSQGNRGVVHGADRGDVAQGTHRSRSISTSHSSEKGFTAWKQRHSTTGITPPRVSHPRKRRSSPRCCPIRCGCTPTSRRPTCSAARTGSSARCGGWAAPAICRRSNGKRRFAGSPLRRSSRRPYPGS